MLNTDITHFAAKPLTACSATSFYHQPTSLFTSTSLSHRSMNEMFGGWLLPHS